MTFAADLAAILDDGLAVDASYRAQGGPDVPVRVIMRAPDDTITRLETVLGSATVILTASVAQVPTPEEGDVFEIGGVIHVVLGDPQRDSRRLRWTIQAMAAS